MAPPNPSWRLPALFVAHALVYFVSGRRFGWHQLQTQLVCGFENAFWHLQIPRAASLPFPWPTFWSMLYFVSGRRFGHSLFAVSRMPFDTSKSLVAPSCRFPWPTLWSTSSVADALGGISSRRSFFAVSRMPFGTSKSLVAPSCPFPGPRSGPCSILRQWPTLWAQLVCGFENAF